MTRLLGIVQKFTTGDRKKKFKSRKLKPPGHFRPFNDMKGIRKDTFENVIHRQIDNAKFSLWEINANVQKTAPENANLFKARFRYKCQHMSL
jgi:hypothetical protein